MTKLWMKIFIALTVAISIASGRGKPSGRVSGLAGPGRGILGYRGALRVAGSRSLQYSMHFTKILTPPTTLFKPELPEVHDQLVSYDEPDVYSHFDVCNKTKKPNLPRRPDPLPTNCYGIGGPCDVDGSFRCCPGIYDEMEIQCINYRCGVDYDAWDAAHGQLSTSSSRTT